LKPDNHQVQNGATVTVALFIAHLPAKMPLQVCALNHGATYPKN